MTDLLEFAMHAHGGLGRWREAAKLTADVSIGGGLWTYKGVSGVLDRTRVTVDCHQQRTVYSPFREAHRHSEYEPTWTAIVTDGGQVIEQRDNPRQVFASHVRETPWDDQNLIYFSGYAMWTYLNTPFLFTLPGFETSEIAPWDEGNELWRRLQVTFPSTVASHCADQVFYFNSQGLLVPHDYSVDVLGGPASANYATEHRSFDQFVFPTKRRVMEERLTTRHCVIV